MAAVACPVCTLYLRQGMSLSQHLHTHPKAQVIAALARLAVGVSEDEEDTPLSLPPPPPPQLTSILYHQQFLSTTTTTTSFVDPSCLPPPPQLIMMAPANSRAQAEVATPPPPSSAIVSFVNTPTQQTATINRRQMICDGIHQQQHTATVDQLDFINVKSSNNYEEDEEEDEEEEDEVEEENAIEPQPPPPLENPGSSAFQQYPQLENLNFQRHTAQNQNGDVLRNEEMAEEEEEEVMNIGTVITDSQKIISNNSSPPPQPVQPLYLQEAQEEEEVGDRVSSPMRLPSPADASNHSGSAAGGGYSVCVRRNPEEYIVPGFEFGEEEEEEDDLDREEEDEDSEAVDDCGLLTQQQQQQKQRPPLNHLHTDESMPARGELSGHGTNTTTNTNSNTSNSSSCSIWQTRELQANAGGQQRTNLTTESWRNVGEDDDDDDDGEGEGGSILPDRACEGVGDALIQFSTNAVAAGDHQQQLQLPAEPFSSVFIQPKKEQVKEEVLEGGGGGGIKEEEEGGGTGSRGGRGAGGKMRRRCATCDEVFATGDEFAVHIRRVHPLECKLCGRCFGRSSALALHRKRHLNVKPYKCSYCEKAFVTRQKLGEHHNTHTGLAPFACTHPDCDATFKRYSNLVQHKKHVHLKVKREPKDYFCDCGQVFHSLLKLAWHKEKHDGQPKKCSYCSSRFVHQASLTRHIRNAHDQHYLPIETKLNLQKTTPTSTASSKGGGCKENVECPICQRVCLKASLRNHLLVHSGVKPFACTTCGKRFYSKWNMKLHAWTHASRSAMPFKCQVRPATCKASFVRESDLLEHVRGAHKKQRPYACNHCGRQFMRRYNCVRHTREHEQAKRHECTVCGKRFHRAYYLTEHMRVHTGLKPFTCHICSKTTATKTNHNKHLKTHHAREIIASEN